MGGSVVRNSSNALVAHVMERIWRGPCGEGAKCTTQFVERGGRLRDRRCSLAGRFLVTKGSRSRDKVESSRLDIDSMSNPK